MGSTQRLMTPGDYDPMVAVQLFYYQLLKTRTAQVGSDAMAALAIRADFWNTQFKSMTRGGGISWWQKPSSVQNEMTYQCDASLGKPSEVDCTQIEWQQLGPMSDSIVIGPGQIKFLHSSEFPNKLSAPYVALPY